MDLQFVFNQTVCHKAFSWFKKIDINQESLPFFFFRRQVLVSAHIEPWFKSLCQNLLSSSHLGIGHVTLKLKPKSEKSTQSWFIRLTLSLSQLPAAVQCNSIPHKTIFLRF